MRNPRRASLELPLPEPQQHRTSHLPRSSAHTHLASADPPPRPRRACSASRRNPRPRNPVRRRKRHRRASRLAQLRPSLRSLLLRPPLLLLRPPREVVCSALQSLLPLLPRPEREFSGVCLVSALISSQYARALDSFHSAPRRRPFRRLRSQARRAGKGTDARGDR